MPRRKTKAKPQPNARGPRIQLPKNALSRVNLGQSFAEYDPILTRPDVFVSTPAMQAALDATRGKCFFIGRRGTGKTALTIRIGERDRCAIQIHPEVFSPLSYELGLKDLAECHQKPFKSLVCAFNFALQFELVYHLLETRQIDSCDLPDFAQRELSVESNRDFDLRVLRLIQSITKPLVAKKDNAWLREIKKPKTLARAINDACSVQPAHYTLLVDRIDDSWDGSDLNVVFLAAFMHACVQMTTQVTCGRTLLFLRENVFERVRAIDKEFSRLETTVVGLDWTPEKLLEVIERRLSLPFNTKLPLGGPTWNHFFENGDAAQEVVFEYCQNRPRDILTYCGLAIETALGKNHLAVHIEDLINARRRFSDSRLKDLCDEYDENYPQLQLVIGRFYGLGWRFTLRGIDAFIKKLLLDNQIKSLCAQWVFNYTTPERLVHLLFQIGFLGISTSRGEILFRSMGPQSTTTPAVGSETDFEIHPVYRDALDLQDVVVGSADTEIEFGSQGLLSDLPGSIDLTEYIQKLSDVEEQLKTLPSGPEHSSGFEDIVGQVIELCFFRSLANVEAKSRDLDGRIVRDWVASNRGQGGFWEAVRIKFGAIQVMWECKNYETLKADDFHQVAYYMNDEIGRFGIVAFRGEIRHFYWEHLRRIAKDKRGIVLLLNDKDLLVFIRQAKAGKVKEAHIQDRYDKTERMVS